MADAGTGGDTGETGVGDDCDLLAPGDELQRRGKLVGFFHAGAHGTDAGEDEDIAGLNLFAFHAFEGADGSAFGGKDAGGTAMTKEAVGIDDGGVDGGGFDDGAFGRDIADGEDDGAGQAAFVGDGWGHDDIIGVDAVVIAQAFTGEAAAVAGFPPIEQGIEFVAGDGKDIGVEDAERAEVAHDFGNAAGHVDLDGGMIKGTVGEGIDET